MDRLWSPWRYQYVTTGVPSTGCIFCARGTEGSDRENFVVHRGTRNYVLLNLYPYASGHLMVVPYTHTAKLEDTEEATVVEMMLLTRRAETALRAVYKPDGINLGMNLGACAGAGVAGHIHMHVLPRWSGDANFLTTIGETRVLPETLDQTWQKLSGAFAKLGA